MDLLKQVAPEQGQTLLLMTELFLKKSWGVGCRAGL